MRGRSMWWLRGREGRGRDRWRGLGADVAGRGRPALHLLLALHLFCLTTYGCNAGGVTHKVQMVAPGTVAAFETILITPYLTATYLYATIWFDGCTVRLRTPLEKRAAWGQL